MMFSTTLMVMLSIARLLLGLDWLVLRGLLSGDRNCHKIFLIRKKVKKLQSQYYRSII